jgi:hypothetical protein
MQGAHYHFEAIVNRNQIVASKPSEISDTDRQNWKFIKLMNVIKDLTKLEPGVEFPEKTYLPDGTTIVWRYCEDDNCYLINKELKKSKKKQEILIQSYEEKAVIWSDKENTLDILGEIEGVIGYHRQDYTSEYIVRFDPRYNQKELEEEIRIKLLSEKP